MTSSPIPNITGMSGPGPDDMNRRARDIKPIMLTMIDMDEGARMRPLDPTKVGELVASIKAHGLLQPIGVQQVKTGRFTTRYRLIYGAHRLAAAIQLHEEYPQHATIACMIYPETMPATSIQMDEMVENLHRKELTPSERAGHTARYAGLLKKAGLVQTAKGKGNTTRAAPVPSGRALEPAAPPKPTVTEKISKELGVHRNAVQGRVTLATKLAARQGVVPMHKTIEKMTADELIAIGDAAVQEGQRKREKASATGKSDRSTDPIEPLKPTQSTVRLDVDNLPDTFVAWVDRRLYDTVKHLTHAKLMATINRLLASARKYETTDAYRQEIANG